MQKIYFIIIVILGSFNTMLQGQDDALKSVLTYGDFITIVKNNHPIAQRARLLRPKGEQIIRSAKGGFDPQLYTYFDQKEFDKKSYFRNLSAGVKVPTNFGAEFKAGYDNNQGIYINNENTVPTAGLVYAGVSMPLLQGLLIDERRATLQQAEIFASMTDIERRKLLNDLVFEGTMAYWEWVAMGNELQTYQQAIELARLRLNGLRITFQQGDKAAIDTLEAFIQLQDRQITYSKAFVKFQKTTLELTNFLWDENGQPLQLQPNVVTPQVSLFKSPKGTIDSLANFIGDLPSVHPDLLLYDLKIKNLDVERRWKKEKLKPKLNINYNFLAEPLGGENGADLSINNFKWGLEFAMPIPMRTARAELQLNDIKRQETLLKRSQKELELSNKALYYNSQIENLKDQIRLSEANIGNYKTLLNAERRKFDMGESSLFVVNSRENKLINAQLKLIELKAKLQTSIIALDWSLGRLE
ncbi:MAG: TolC family protein [Saprospiraceae bacterium]